ncbi:hypothetical protein QCE62_21575 [Caballeronia sp. LZ033]|uniref:hypothetical protein n=1 Tax=Caballeronia sp. LZ033 TaxID=3038566 RepID=UPI002859FB43|nr:hypothetical protein [Caballeronia sp. LZ033]MDR5816187.1 hypothetical protein [Caballeronia sp. LZ033]
MERPVYAQAIAQLTGAAELIAADAPAEQRAEAFETLAYFRLLKTRVNDTKAPAVSNDELFKDTATAALTLAGRKEFLAAAALLEQARGLLRG